MENPLAGSISRRGILGAAAMAAITRGAVQAAPAVVAGVDRVTVLPGRTYLRGSAATASPVRWSKESGPGEVRFADAAALLTTATFTMPGTYILRLAAGTGEAAPSDTLKVLVEDAPPSTPLETVYPAPFRIDSRFWGPRFKALIVNWIPHCIEIINRSDVKLGPGGIDNFIEAGKKLRGEPAGLHKGYVFSNAWVHQTVEAMSLALMVDPQGDAAIAGAQEKFRATLEQWIPIILAAQEPDGYLQTAFSLDRASRSRRVVESSKFRHWDPAHRGDHEGYVAGYFLESAIAHYLMSGRKDARLYRAARKLADCWAANLGPAPKKPWYDGHQGMEQALVRFGELVNETESGGQGERYVRTAKFLLDCRYTAAADPKRERQEYDQSHLPVTQQYEVVGHAVRASYTCSGMAHVAVRTGDVDYRSAVRSLWDNIVNKKYYLTGGIGSGETSEGFGPDYSLPNHGYCESCSSCGMIFFHWKMNQAYADARYADNYEETLYNALLGSVDLEGRNFYYTNPLDGARARSSWHTCPCCVGNIPRTLLMAPTWTYAKAPDGVYVNLYMGSRVTLANAAGTDIEMVQETDYPWSGKVVLTVNPKRPGRFTVRLRLPNRATSRLYTPVPAAEGLLSLRVAGAPITPSIERGYAVITRRWKAGDRIELELPLKVQQVSAAGEIAATRGKVALRYGPLIYNAESVDQDITKALDPSQTFTQEWRGDLLGGVMAITGRYVDGSRFVAIPNYARLNRNTGLPAEGGPLSGNPALYAGPNAPDPDAAQSGEGRRRPLPPASIVWIARG